MAARPQNIESLRSLAEQIIWAAQNYGYPEPLHAATAFVGFDTTKEHFNNYFLCSGAADDVEINAAIDYVEALGGGRVVLLEGNYSIDATIDIIGDRVTLQGQGGGTTITATGDFDAIYAHGAATGDRRRYLSFRDFRVIGPASGSGTGLHLHWINDSEIYNVYAASFGDNGIWVEVCFYINVLNCHTYQNQTVGIRAGANAEHCTVENCHSVEDERGIQWMGNVMHIFDCTVEACTGTYAIYAGQHANVIGCHIDMAEGSGIAADSYSTIVGNNVKHCENYFIHVNGWGISCVGNHLHHPNIAGVIGIYVDDDDNTIVGNTLWQMGLTYGTSSGIQLNSADDCVVSNNNIYENNDVGIELIDSSNCLISGNEINTSTTYNIFIDGNSDNNVVRGNLTYGAGTAECRIDDATCNDNDFSGGNDFRGTFTDLGTGTIFPSIPFQFVKEIVGEWLTTSPTGIEVDADTEGAICLGHLPRYVRQVMRLRIWAVALDAPIGAGGQMHAEFIFNAAAGNEAYNLAANSWVLINHDSEEADYVANDVIQWVIEDGDVGNELVNLLGGDKFELIVMHEASADPDGATDAVFGSMEVEYV